jgi:hypothetical protein
MNNLFGLNASGRFRARLRKPILAVGKPGVEQAKWRTCRLIARWPSRRIAFDTNLYRIATRSIQRNAEQLPKDEDV